MNIHVLFFNFQTTLACNLKGKRKTCSKSPPAGVFTCCSDVTGDWPYVKHSGFFFFLPVRAPVVCVPEDLTGALAPGTHHTVQCFCDSVSRGW